MHIRSSLFALCLCSAAVTAQNRYIVDAMNGPGTNFTSLPAAFAAAVHGDTLVVRGNAMFPVAYTGATTDQGITVVGVDVPVLNTQSQPLEVANLPAGESFRMVGFDTVRDSQLRARVIRCQGSVLFEDLHNDEFGAIPAQVPGLEIQQSDFVSLHRVSLFGFPAIAANDSHVLCSDSLLGTTRIGLGLGWIMTAAGSTIEISQPQFVSPSTGRPAIELIGSDLVVGGDAASLIETFTTTVHTQPAIFAVGGTVTVDPLVTLNSRPNQAFVADIEGTATVANPSVPTALTRPMVGGLEVRVTAQTGDLVFGLLGLPSSPYPTPFGNAVLQPAPLATLFAVTMPGPDFQSFLPVPPGTAQFGGFGVQTVTIDGSTGALRASLGCHFVIR